MDLALANNCEGVAWTYNEPSIWLNYTLDCAKLCKSRGLYTVYVTNGYATPEHLDMIGPYLDVYRLDVKSMDDGFYKKMAKVPGVQGILDLAVRAKSEWGMHIECVTNVIPGFNDSDENLRRIARWIAESLGRPHAMARYQVLSIRRAIRHPADSAGVCSITQPASAANRG